VVDLSGYVPRETLEVCQRLEPVTARYVFMSTVSVYRGWPVEPLSERSEVLYCPPDAGPEYGEDVEDGPTRYGYQKSGCELAVTRTFGPGRSTVLRPGVVLGPREYVGRLPWWLRRVASGGRVLAPGSPDRSVQPVDVRDLADFALLAAERGIPGAFNVAAPMGRETFGGCSGPAPRSPGRARSWCGWRMSNCWRRGYVSGRRCRCGGPSPESGRWTPGAALAAGLTCRRLDATVADTWAWLRSSGTVLGDERAGEIGLSREREQQILGSVG
jgi:hypothetical protein